LVIVAAAFLAAGCGGVAAEGKRWWKPFPAVPVAGAPKVPNPLPDARSVLAGDPCTDSMTPERLVAAIGVVVPGKREDLAPLGPACGWFNRDTGGAIGVSYTLNTHVGISGVYENTRPQSGVFRELPPVRGFPAVIYSGSKGDTGPFAFCQATVALTDRISLDISLSLGTSKSVSLRTQKSKIADACELVPQIADMAVQSLLEHARR
jgi:hypothetical protein